MMQVLIFEIWDKTGFLAVGASTAGLTVVMRSGLAALFALCLTLVFGRRVIRKLISMKLGQPLRTEEEVRQLAALHAGKKGTPTMGGILIIASMAIAMLIFCDLKNAFVWIALFVLIAHGVIGFFDDYAKIKGQNSKGLSSRQKLLGQAIVGLTAGLVYYGCVMYFPNQYGYQLLGNAMSAGDVFMPGWGKVLISLGWGIVPIFAFVIVGSSNAVNLTDGLDGLAIGCTMTASVAYGIAALILGSSLAGDLLLHGPQNPALAEMGVVMGAMLGAGGGFLCFNRYPAKVFMGDTGSLALGACLGVVALMCKLELLLVLIGGVFVVEALSVIIQVTSYRYRQQRRVFRCAPLHHHYQLCGWHELKVIRRFWFVSFLCALIGLAVLLIK